MEKLGLQNNESINPPDIHSYTDFRKYLKDFYDYKVFETRKSISPYSYKTFSAAADMRSPNYLKLVIHGDRNLTAKSAKKFARALSLNRLDSEEFLLLVEYGQAMDPLERNRHLKALSEYRMQRRVRTGEVKAETIENSPHWVAWLLYALADHKEADFSMEGLRGLLRGRIKDTDLNKAFEMLLDNGSLVQDATSGAVQKGKVAPPSLDDVPAEIIRKLQSELIYIGMESLLNDSVNEREFGSLTLCLTEEEFKHLKFELRHMRKRVFKENLVAREQAPGDAVYQMNIQLFPVTESKKN